MKSLTWIQTKPPIPYAEIDRLIATVEASSKLAIDGTVLGTALRFVYFLGLRKKEILDLRIGDVLDQSLSVRPKIIFGQDLIPVPPNVIQAIDDYSRHLRFLYRKKLLPTLYFFPGRNRKQYDDSTLGRHVDHFARDLGFKITLEKIRQAGICRFYGELRVQNQLAPWEAMEATASFGRIESIYHTADLLQGQTWPWGGRAKPATRVEPKIPMESITEHLRNTVDIAETEAMEIIKEKFPKSSFSCIEMVQEFVSEFVKAIQRSVSLADNEKQELTSGMYAQLRSCGFGIDEDDGSLVAMCDFVQEE